MVLLVAATYNEVKNLQGSNPMAIGQIQKISFADRNDLYLLVTGVGPVPTAYHLTNALSTGNFSKVINVGIAGAYNKAKFKIGDVTIVTQDTFGDYGVDDRGTFKTLYQINIANPNEKPFVNGWLSCKSLDVFKTSGNVSKVKGVTVGTASGSELIINRLQSHYSADIETMESAAFFYCCLMKNLPFICVRSISNWIEPRDKSQWNIPLAIDNLHAEIQHIIKNLK
jgi:futalosine hydrolase